MNYIFHCCTKKCPNFQYIGIWPHCALLKLRKCFFFIVNNSNQNFPRTLLLREKQISRLISILSPPTITRYKENQREKEQRAMLCLEIRPLSLQGEWCRAHRAGGGQLSVGKDSAGLGPDQISPALRTHMAGSAESPALSFTATSQLKWRGVFLGLTWMRAFSAELSNSFSGYSPCPTSGLNKQHLLLWTLGSHTIYLALQIIHEHYTLLSTIAVMVHPGIMLNPAVSHLCTTQYIFCYI